MSDLASLQGSARSLEWCVKKVHYAAWDLLVKHGANIQIEEHYLERAYPAHWVRVLRLEYQQVSQCQECLMRLSDKTQHFCLYMRLNLTNLISTTGLVSVLRQGKVAVMLVK